MRHIFKAGSLLPTVVLVALLARAAVLTLEFHELTVDRDAYLGLAQSLADGHGYRMPGTHQPTAYRPPLYPLLLAGVSLISQPLGEAAFPAGIAVLQLLAGAGTVWLTWRVVRWRLPSPAPQLAALLVAFDPLLVLYTARPMTETLCTLLAILLLDQIEQFRAVFPREEPAGDEAASSAWHAVSAWQWCRRGLPVGLVFGLCVLCRPTFWVFGGLCLLACGWCIWRMRHASPWWHRMLMPAGAVAGALLLVAPWVARNWWVFGVPVLATTHGGYTLLLANNPVFFGAVVDAPAGTVWQGDSLAAWQQGLEDELARAGIAGNDEINRDRWMRQRAVRHMKAVPGQTLRGGWLKLRRFFGILPQGAPAAGRKRWIALAGAALFVAQYLLLLAACFRWRLRLLHLWWPAVLLVVSFSLVHAVYWSNARMRAPVIPALAVLASASVVAPGRQPQPATNGGDVRNC